MNDSRLEQAAIRIMRKVLVFYIRMGVLFLVALAVIAALTGGSE